MKLIHSTANFLRGLALVQMLILGIVFMPMAWIAEWHSWLGLGPLPDDPAFRYLIRGAGFVQAAIGVLLWVMASDVVRYRPLVISTGIIYLVGAPFFYFINTFAGMPRFWCLLDFSSCLLVGLILLTLCQMSANDSSSPTPQPVA